jgi:hypothetical protein
MRKSTPSKNKNLSKMTKKRKFAFFLTREILGKAHLVGQFKKKVVKIFKSSAKKVY